MTKGPKPTAQQEAAFQQRQLLAERPSPVLGKVFGKRNESHIDTALPPITSQVRIPTGDEPPEEKKAPPPITVDQAIIEEAQQKAAALLQAAQKKANEALTAAAQKIQQFQELAKTKAEEANKAAYAQGLEQGRVDGRQQGHDEYLKLMLHARDLYIQAIKERDKLIDNTEPELARLSVAIAERLIGQEINSNGEFIMSVVRDALADCKDREQVIIRVAPDDYHLVNNDRSTFARMVEGLKDFDLVIDSKIEPGGCIIETNLGNIDARLNTQIAAIKAAFEHVCQTKESGDNNASPED